MQNSKEIIFKTVHDYLNILGFTCEYCGNVKMMIYIGDNPKTCLGYLDVSSNKTMPVLTIEHYPNDSNAELKKDLIHILSSGYYIKKLKKTEIPCNKPGRFRETFEILEFKNDE